jgi:uncharacterized protein
MNEWEAGLPKLKAAYEAWHESKGGSVDTWIAMLDDECDFRSLGNGRDMVPWTQRRHSRDEVRGYLRGLTDEFAMKEYKVDRFVCQDDTIVAIGSTAWTCKRTGKMLDTPKVDVWRFRNGKAVAFFEYFDTAELVAAATP